GISEFTQGKDAITRLLIEHGGLFKFAAKLAKGEIKLPPPATARRPMTMAEKILASHALGAGSATVFAQPGDALLVRVDAGYSHEFTTAQVHDFLGAEFG